MFGLWKHKQPRVVDHWWVAAEGLQSSTGEFYDEIEAELERVEAPDVDSGSVYFAEGPLGAGSRRYLRMRRERLVFDVCSAPFGKSWFFSCRIAVIPFSLRVWELLALVALGYFAFSIYPATFGMFWGIVAFAGTVLGLLAVVNAFAVGGRRSLDHRILDVPILGALYELFLRRNDTYYQQDMRIMYATFVGNVVQEKVREFAAAGGVEEVEFERAKDPMSPRGLRQQLSDWAKDTFGNSDGKSG